MIYRARLYWLINCLNGREWLWPAGHRSTGNLVYGPWPTSELIQVSVPALEGGRSLSVYIYAQPSYSVYI